MVIIVIIIIIILIIIVMQNNKNDDNKDNNNSSNIVFSAKRKDMMRTKCLAVYSYFMPNGLGWTGKLPRHFAAVCLDC